MSAPKAFPDPVPLGQSLLHACRVVGGAAWCAEAEGASACLDEVVVQGVVVVEVDES